MTESQSKNIAADANDKIPQKMSEPFGSVDVLGAKMDMNVKNLEDNLYDGLKTEGIQKKKDCHNLDENEEESGTRKCQCGGMISRTMKTQNSEASARGGARIGDLRSTATTGYEVGRSLAPRKVEFKEWEPDN